MTELEKVAREVAHCQLGCPICKDKLLAVLARMKKGVK
jgi:hypothetical protein